MAKAELFVTARHHLGEAIIWHGARQCLFWIDLLEPALFHHDPVKGRTASRALPLPPPIGAIVATEDAGLLAITHRQGVSLLDIDSLALKPWCDPESGRDQIIYNDAKADRFGRLWVGTSHAQEKEARGALWCIASDRRFALGDAGFAISNGPAFSPDGQTLYFNDSLGRATYAYDMSEASLSPRNRRVLVGHAEEDGLPDGIVTDAEGCLWIAHWGGSRISRFAPDGRKLAQWPLPAPHVTTMCFGGPDLATLYITTARDGLDEESLSRSPMSGSLFRLETGIKGLAEPLMRLDVEATGLT